MRNTIVTSDSGERVPFRWWGWVLGLFVVLALILAFCLRTTEAVPVASMDEGPEAQEESPVPAGGAPEAIALEVQELEVPVLPEGDPDAALVSGDVVFRDRLDSGVELEIRRANPVRTENGGVFYDVYALTRSPNTEWKVLGQLADYNHYVGNGLDLAERVPDILGREGWQISLEVGAAAVISWYFAAEPERVELLLSVGSSEEAQVLDVDGDGQGEAMAWYNHGFSGWYLYDDTPEGGLREYYLSTTPDAPVKVELLPGEGFAVLDADGAPVRYVLKDGALRRF